MTIDHLTDSKAPTVAAGMLTLTESVRYSSQSLAISLQQSPGVARSLWPAGDDISRTYQIGQLQEQVSNISVELSNSLSSGLHLLMTDVPTFVQFADNGRYSNNNPPLDPNSIKNQLAITLQTYLASESTKQNGWYAIPLGISTQEEYQNLQDPPCATTLPNRCANGNEITVDQIYWSPTTGRQYRFLQKGGGPVGSGQILKQLISKDWANLPLFFDGAFNCTAYGQLNNPQLVHVNFDGTLDISCISRLPIQIPCGAPCPQAAADGSCPFPFDADCSNQNGGGDAIHGGIQAPDGSGNPPPSNSSGAPVIQPAGSGGNPGGAAIH